MAKTRIQSLWKLSAEVLADAFLLESAVFTYPEAVQPALVPLKLGPKDCRATTMAYELWDRLGQVVNFTTKQQSILSVRVPELEDILIPTIRRLESLLEDSDRRSFTVLAGCASDAGDGIRSAIADGTFSIRTVIPHLEEMPLLAQTDLLSAIRPRLGVFLLLLKLFGAIREKMPEEVRSLFEDDARSRDLHKLSIAELDKLTKSLARQGVRDRSMKHYVGVTAVQQHFAAKTLQEWLPILDVYYWEYGSMPSARVNKFLPPGYWPEGVGVMERDPDVPELVLSDRPITIATTTLSEDRFRFYTESLGCKGVLEPEGEFRTRNYEAFMLRTQRGNRFAILDCQARNNAAYVFRIGYRGQEDDTRWSDLAQQSKHRVLETKDSDGPFVRRVFHSKNWKDRMAHFVAIN